MVSKVKQINGVFQLCSNILAVMPEPHYFPGRKNCTSKMRYTILMLQLLCVQVECLLVLNSKKNQQIGVTFVR